MIPSVPLWGVVGWKNSGKTTLMCALIEELNRRGIRVGSIKHAHHTFEVDRPGRDSYRHTEAGASPVAVVSKTQLALIDRRHRSETEQFRDALELVQSRCALVFCEGFKGSELLSFPKIEARCPQFPTDISMVADEVEGVEAVVCDQPCRGDFFVFRWSDISLLVDFCLRRTPLAGTSSKDSHGRS